MKVKIKKNLIIFEELYEWSTVEEQLKQEYGDNIFLISWRTKRELGFTVRHHRTLSTYEADWVEVDYVNGAVKIHKIAADLEHRYHYIPQIHLDFYNDSSMTWFVLKYLNNTQIN